MKRISAVRAYAGIVGLLGAGVLVSSALPRGVEAIALGLWPGALALLFLYLLSASWVVRGLQGGAILSTSPILLFSLLLIAGSQIAALAAAVQVAYTNLWIRRLRDERVAVNIGQSVLSVTVAGWIYQALGGVTGPPGENTLVVLSRFLPLQLAGAHFGYLLLNTGLVAIGISLRDHCSRWLYWRINYLPMMRKSFATPVAAFAVARLFLSHEYLGVLLLFGLMLIELIHAKAKLAITRSRDRTIESLLAISGVTKPYSEEEAAERTRLAQDMGRHLGLSQTRLERLREGITLHNIGYVGLDPSMLRTNGPLTQQQFDKVRRHPIIGARILLRVPWLREVAWIVLCHHERPDGQGYPLRLNAGEAPTEAYIISAVEGFCSLKYGREHQEAMGPEGSFREIMSHAGSRYDRAAVAALARSLDLPVPPHLHPYLRARLGKGDPHLKEYHLEEIAPREDTLSPEELGLFASFTSSQPGPGLLAAFRRGRRMHMGSREVFRARLFALALSLLTLALLLGGQGIGHIAWLDRLSASLLWASLAVFSSLLSIRLPGGASVTAATSVCLAAALIEGPLLGAALGAAAGAISGTLWREERTWRPLILAANYAGATALAGFLSRLAGGLPILDHFPRPSWVLATLGCLGAVVAFCLVETVAMSIWNRPALSGPAGRAKILRPFEDPENFGRDSEGEIDTLAPPWPDALSVWGRWRANYQALFPEPLAYPAAGLLMALACNAIGFWSVGVVLVYPVLWSHFRLEERLRLSDSRLRLLLSISQAIDARHHYTQGHSLRVGLWAGALAQKLGYSSEYARQLRLAGMLHDLGKASWTDAMLEKPRRLTPKESGLKEEHPVLSARVAHTSFPVAEAPILQHHEDWDGNGYPYALEGPRMDAGARIVRVADTLDAIVSGRPYKLKEGRKDPLEEIQRYAYADFDPAVAAALTAMASAESRGERECLTQLSRRRQLTRLAGGEIMREALHSLLRRSRNGDSGRIRSPEGRPLEATAAGLPAGPLYAGEEETVARTAVLLATRVHMKEKGRESLRLAALYHQEDARRRVNGGLIPRACPGTAELRRLAGHPCRVARRLGRWGLDGGARAILLSHHERWNGGGFPAGLRGESIPLGARILALACAYAELISPAPFRRALTADAAASEILLRGGTVFDPELAGLLATTAAEGHLELAGIHRPTAEDVDSGGGARSGGLAAKSCPSSRDARDRLWLHCRRLVAWAEDLGVPSEKAQLLLFRHEVPGGQGPQGVDWRELTPFVTRFRLELLFLEVLRHHPRPLSSGIVCHALRQMEWFSGWAAPAEEIARFQAEVRARGLPWTVGFAEWDRLSQGIELGGEWARDEAVLFAYYLWITGPLAPAPPSEYLVRVGEN